MKTTQEFCYLIRYFFIRIFLIPSVLDPKSFIKIPILKLNIQSFGSGPFIEIMIIRRKKVGDVNLFEDTNWRKNIYCVCVND